MKPIKITLTRGVEPGQLARTGFIATVDDGAPYTSAWGLSRANALQILGNKIEWEERDAERAAADRAAAAAKKAAEAPPKETP